MAFAHTGSRADKSDWEPLSDHLAAVAELASEFAESFGASEWGHLLGVWHDLGKFAPAFQRYLELSSKGDSNAARVDHSTAGALHASRAFSAGRTTGVGVVVASAIAGHHAGLPDFDTGDDSCLCRRLDHPRPESIAALSAAPAGVLDQSPPPVPSFLSSTSAAADRPLAHSLFTRMLFSALIDADRLATERFRSPETAAGRQAFSRLGIHDLHRLLDEHLERLMESRSGTPSAVDAHRRALLTACRNRAPSPPGIFTLTAPTGCGKTLSSMAFALEHARLHGLRRVIYALPFTSVTEQCAEQFRLAFGTDAVLEHHSAYRSSDGDALPGAFEESEDPTSVRTRLLAENWDAPIVVTTNVRLLESLFAASPSDCRRLHRLAHSVVVLDEAQALPVHLLKPTLAALQELSASYRVSVVLCSATVPAVTIREGIPIGLRGVEEIVPDPPALARAMRRVDVARVGPLNDDALADRIAREPTALAIVNTRGHAARLFTLLRDRDVEALHLSALMCPIHRSERVKEIKRRLAAGESCRVVSTQVVEAGIDIDFPLVLRAMAGLDSIVQAAGRCNREGRLARGKVEVFDTDEQPSPGVRLARGDAEQVLVPGVDPLGLDTIDRYFGLHYWSRSGEWDGGDRGPITAMLRPPGDPKSHKGGFLFRQAADAYQVIDEYSTSVVVPFGEEGRKLCDLLMDPHKSVPSLFRRIQPYTVSVSPWLVQQLVAATCCMLSPLGPAVLVDAASYDDDLGLRPAAGPTPESLVV
jgi:CRISPR-associated endonuclease/helicase Cas3